MIKGSSLPHFMGLLSNYYQTNTILAQQFSVGRFICRLKKLFLPPRSAFPSAYTDRPNNEIQYHNHANARYLK